MELQQIQEREDFKIREYIQILLKRKWTIILCFVVVFVSSMIMFYSAEPIYRSSTKILIEKQNPKAMYLEDMLMNSAKNIEYFQTEFMIIQGREVVRKLVKKMKLNQSPEFNTRRKYKPWAPAVLWASVKQFGIEVTHDLLLPLNRGKNSVEARVQSSDQGSDTDNNKNAMQGDPLKSYVNKVMARISVSHVPNTNIVNINFNAWDPKLAASASNELAKTYIEHDLQYRTQSTQQAIQWLLNKIREERKAAELAELKFLEFKDKNKLLSTDAGGSGELTTQKILGFKSELTRAKNASVELEYRYRQAQKLLDNPVILECSSLLNEYPILKNITGRIFELNRKLSELSITYGQNHPSIVGVKSELKIWNDQKKIELKKFVDATRTEYELAKVRESSVRDNLESFKQDMFDINQKAVEFSMLKRAAEHARELLNIMVTRFKEASISEDQVSSSIRIIENAQISSRPINRQPRKLMTGALLGLILGVGLAFFLERLDNTIKSPDDIKRFGLTYLTSIPFFKIPLEKEKGIPPEMIVHNSPKAAASEAYRTLRTNILFSSADSPPKVALITGPGINEGKTMTVINLGATMAKFGSKTIIIDCDMRKPWVHKLFNLSKDQGLSNMLTGMAKVSEIIVKTEIENLDVVCSGPISPNPAELLGSPHMAKFIEFCREHYDHIIIDSPPFSSVTDAPILSRMVDGVVFIFRSRDTTKQMVKNIVDVAGSVQAKLLGVVLNAVDMNKEAYYYQYNYYYSGEDTGKQR
jgi:capsular exopolysaccharide synthesis family protein